MRIRPRLLLMVVACLAAGCTYAPRRQLVLESFGMTGLMEVDTSALPPEDVRVYEPKPKSKVLIEQRVEVTGPVRVIVLPIGTEAGE